MLYSIKDGGDMGILCELDTTRRTVFIVWDGIVTPEDWYRNVHELLAKPELPSIQRIIVDSHTVTNSSDIGDTEIEIVTGLLQTQIKTMFNKSMAVYADNMFGRAKKAETAISRLGIAIVVFNRLDTACTFLGIQPEKTREMLEGLRLKLREQEDQF